MQISFDITDSFERSVIRDMIAVYDTDTVVVGDNQIVVESPAPAAVPTEGATPAPVAPVVPSATPAQLDPRVGEELDINGTPWIEEVHAGTKSKTAEGVWKKRRGVHSAVVEEAEDAARAKLAGTPEPVTPPAPAPVETVESVAPATMDDLSAAYSKVWELGLLEQNDAFDLYQKHGCEQINDIASNETARAGVVAELKDMIANNRKYVRTDAAPVPGAPVAPVVPGA